MSINFIIWAEIDEQVVSEFSKIIPNVNSFDFETIFESVGDAVLEQFHKWKSFKHCLINSEVNISNLTLILREALCLAYVNAYWKNKQKLLNPEELYNSGLLSNVNVDIPNDFETMFDPPKEDGYFLELWITKPSKEYGNGTVMWHDYVARKQFQQDYQKEK